MHVGRGERRTDIKPNFGKIDERGWLKGNQKILPLKEFNYFFLDFVLYIFGPIVFSIASVIYQMFHYKKTFQIP